MDIKPLLEQMLAKKASDLHVRANGPSIMRIDGTLVPVDKVLTPEDTMKIALSLMNDEQKMVFNQRHEVDLAYTFERIGRFRINVFMQRGVIHLAFRIIPVKVPTIEDLKLPGVISQISDNRRGLVLVTGTTGCGKSNTLAAIINHINSTRTENIITIEDPIEFIHTDNKSIISQRELGFDTLSYLDALRNVVRQDPDVVLLGEMRDLDTVATAITAAQTGHLVLSTLHTVSAAQSINRIIDLFPPHQQNQTRLLLADVLKAVISQRLLPHAGGKGRVPAVEILVVTPLVKKMIEDNNIPEIVNLMRQGQYYGMQTFNQALIKLFQGGEIKLEDALAAASNPEELMLAVRGIQTSTENAGQDFIER
ncbi:MAG: type IV pilus twitching motility protein PilT [Endomicrobiales bacterium]|nr:type IV pilus twitching motility protein PilT [Endomicrobiales bacterium]